MELTSPPAADMSRHRACDPCRKRKVRCSRHIPRCERCSYFSLSCEYSPVGAMGRPRKRRATQSRSPEHTHTHTQTASSSESAPMPTTTPAELINMPGLAAPMDDIFGSFSASIPQLDMGFPPAPDDQMQHDATSTPDQCIPCMLNHGFSVPSGRSTDGDTASTAASGKCKCVQLVNQHFTSIQDSLETFRSLGILQQSVQSAESIMECGTCFGPIEADPGTCRNVYLLGSLLSSISSSYGDFYLRQRQRAAESAKSGDAIKISVGQPPDEHVTVGLSLDGQNYGNFIKASLRAELARLLKVSEAFAERQTQIHNRGHEGCEKEKPCTNTKYLPAGKRPADVCPKVVDITKAFACFRTVDQVWAVMEETEQIISS